MLVRQFYNLPDLQGHSIRIRRPSAPARSTLTCQPKPLARIVPATPKPTDPKKPLTHFMNKFHPP